MLNKSVLSFNKKIVDLRSSEAFMRQGQPPNGMTSRHGIHSRFSLAISPRHRDTPFKSLPWFYCGRRRGAARGSALLLLFGEPRSKYQRSADRLHARNKRQQVAFLIRSSLIPGADVIPRCYVGVAIGAASISLRNSSTYSDLEPNLVEMGRSSMPDGLRWMACWVGSRTVHTDL